METAGERSRLYYFFPARGLAACPAISKTIRAKRKFPQLVYLASGGGFNMSA
jgi:hypothetical protein